jgi:molybdate/tungstate transport system permease protein
VSWAASTHSQVAPAGSLGPAGAGGPPPGRRWPAGAAVPRGLRHLSGSLAVVGTGIIWLALLGPVIALATHLSWSSVKSSLDTPGAWDPLLVSVQAGAVTLAVLLLLGTPLAWALARGTLPFPRVWEIGVLASLLLPPLVIGLLLIFLIGPYTFIGQWLSDFNISTTNTFLALVVAEIYESAPYYVLGAQAAFASVDPRLEQQAALLGDSPRRVLRRVTIPLAAPGLAMSLAVGWARAMGAFGAVVIIAYHPTGLPMQIWTSLQETGLSSALPFALVLLVVALPLPIAAYVWSARARSRRRG